MSLTSYILIILLIGTTLSCQSTYELSNSGMGCVFYVNYLDDTCTNFSLDKCTWRTCTLYRYQGGYRKGCLQYSDIVSTDWNKCTDMCCEEEVNYPLASSSIQQCQDYLDSKFKTIIIILAVGGGLALLLIITTIVIICYCECASKCKASCSNCCTSIFNGIAYLFTCQCFRNPEKIDKVVAKSQSIDVIVKNNVLEGNKTINWLLNRGKSIDQIASCGYCNVNSPSIQLHCGHSFHRLCLTQILQQKQCSVCKTGNLDRTHIYCEECYRWYYQVDQSDLAERCKMRQVCPECK